jgi:hypothetical protein
VSYFLKVKPWNKESVMKQAKIMMVLGAVLWMGATAAQAGAGVHGKSRIEGYALTVYNNDLVLVRDQRKMKVGLGIHSLRFEDIASTLDPTSVNVSCLSNPKGFRVLEQNYEYDLVNQQKLLQKYIGQEITLLKFGGEKGPDLTVKLLSAEGNQLVVQKSDGSLLNVYSSGNVQFPKLPEGLILRPSLQWLVDSNASGEQTLNLAYLASGMSWHSDYTLLVNEDETSSDFDGWVTMNNNTGTTFTNAKLKLLAGEVNRVEGHDDVRKKMGYAARSDVAMEANAPSFAEKAFGEYHLYTLDRTTTGRNNETKQIELLSAASVPVKKLYRYDGAGVSYWWGEGNSDRYYGTNAGNKKIDVFFELNNAKEAGLGQPLPAGKIRIYKKDDDGSQEFLGEDSIDHTPKDEKVKLKMGTAFDVTGERKQTDFNNKAPNQIEETFQITLKNHKKDAVTVNAIEHLYRYSNWKIEDNSHPFNKVDSRTVDFPVKVPADGKVVVTYKVKYWWK